MYLGLSVGTLLLSRRALAADEALNLMDPSLWGGLTLSVLFGISPSYRILRSHELNYGLAQPDDVGVLLIAAVGISSYFAGIKLAGRPSGRRPHHPQERWIQPRFSVCILVFTSMISLAIYSIYIRRIGVGAFFGGRSAEVAGVASNQYITAAPVLFSAVLAALLAADPRLLEDKLFRITGSFGVLLAAASFLPQGGRRFLIPALLIPTVTVWAVRQRTPTKRLLLASGLLLVLLLTIVSIGRSAGARSERGGVGGIVTSLAESPVDVVDRILLGSDTEMVVFLGFAKPVMDSEGPNFGIRLAEEAIFAPFPSAIIGPKPISDKDATLIELFGAPCGFTAGGACPDYSILGALYWAGGYSGVALGMASVGFGLRRSWIHWVTRPFSRRRTLLIAALVAFSPIVIRKGLLEPAIWPLFFLLPGLAMLFVLEAGRQTRKPVEDRKLANLMK